MLSMFFSARCMAASRLAFSLASDSAQAWKRRTKRYPRTKASSADRTPPITCGTVLSGHGVEDCFAIAIAELVIGGEPLSNEARSTNLHLAP